MVLSHLKLFDVVDVSGFLSRVSLQQYSCRVIMLNGSVAIWVRMTLSAK